MRPWVVSEVVRDLIGTRGGRHEEISDPYVEYLVGTLGAREDAGGEVSTDVSQSPLPGANSLDDSQDNASDGLEVSNDVPPSLDPKKRSSTMGLTFTCTGPEDDSPPDFELAVTYARYAAITDSEDDLTRFRRIPRAIHISSDEIASQLNQVGRAHRGEMHLRATEESPDSSLSVVDSDDEHETRITLVIRRDHRTDSVWVVSVMMDTKIQKWTGEYNTIERAQRTLFQPCIRVLLRKGASLCERPRGPPKTGENDDQITDEDAVDDLLYEGRRELAHGHLCSAVWVGVDPQQIDDDERALMTVRLRQSEDAEEEEVTFGLAPPFYWEDGEHPALAEVRDAFSTCDVRTEFLPVIDLPSPDMDPKPSDVPEWGEDLVIRPRTLAVAFESQAIDDELKPLVDGYETWMKNRLSGNDPLHLHLRSEAEECHRRMKAGLKLLNSDEDARLAFNIANQALDLTHQWVGFDGFKWRKFQISFALSCLESSANLDSDERQSLDLLWVATGGGKTEAYLLLTAFVTALRRIRGAKEGTRWFGVDVITRYTLRLLTIQQFRRALGVITAMEHLRAGSVNLPLGRTQDELGTQPFGIGIWVGGGVTHNALEGATIDANDLEGVRHKLGQDCRGNSFNLQRDVKALRHLVAGNRLKPDQSERTAEAAQVLNCPCCDQPLAIMRSKETGHSWGESRRGRPHRLHLLVETDLDEPTLLAAVEADARVSSLEVTFHHAGFATLSITPEGMDYEEQAVESLWRDISETCRKLGEMNLIPARASRPGYFLRTYRYTHQGSEREGVYDFQVNCPDPSCKLNQQSWTGELPAGSVSGRRLDDGQNEHGVEVPEALRAGNQSALIARGTPIPAYTVDDQIYGKAPSLIISTVDKFARMPFNPMTGNLFGNVDHHSELVGFERAGAGPRANLPTAVQRPASRTVPVGRLPAPTLIVQDELHLIEGPLGSMVGFYETAIDRLISEGLSGPDDEDVSFRPKYVASTATIRKAEDQVKCLFDRSLNLFPPKGPTWDDRGLILERTSKSPHKDESGPGRLYIGISPIGISAQVLQRNLFSRLIHCGEVLRRSFEGDLERRDDRYWTVTGYYNAVRELAGAKSILEQDTNARLQALGSSRSASHVVELSGRMQSTELPILLDRLENVTCSDTGSIDTLLTTSMFGTGVDVTRLNVMTVAGQPKTTSQYIQATGRVGRENGAIVSTYLRASRPRDLDHYERFIGYHLQLYRNVEPVTVRPFSDSVIDRAGGPLMVSWMRLSDRATGDWRTDASAGSITHGHPDLALARKIIDERNNRQPELRRINYSPPNAMQNLLTGLQDDWQLLADQAAADSDNDLLWKNPMTEPAPYVVLGDVSNVKHPTRYQAAYSYNHPTPQSLRTVDATTAVQER